VTERNNRRPRRPQDRGRGRFIAVRTTAVVVGCAAIAAATLAHAQGTTAPVAEPPAVPPPPSAADASRAYDALARAVAPAVVQILAKGYAPDESGLLARSTSSGSGVVLDAAGYVVTNAHVVAGARTLQVQLAGARAPDGRSILQPRGRVLGAQLVGLDRETDLALLKVDPGGIALPARPLGDSEELAQGQLVFAFGSPFGLESTVTMGVVSAVARQVEPDAPMVYIQTDAAINPGNSGGPLVDAAGRVVGINTFIVSKSGGSDGLGFAIPSNIVRAVYEQLRTSGRVRRGMIGVRAQTITPALGAGLQIQRDWGVIVADVVPGGPAAKAGLRAGDVVVALDGKTMENARQMDVNIYRRRIGDSVTLDVVRTGQPLTVRVPVVERDDDPGRFMDLVTPEHNLVPKLGILALELNRHIASMLPPLRQETGVVVAASNAIAFHEDEQFLPGDVIYAVNGKAITSLEALRAAIAALRPGAAAVAHIERHGALQYVTFEIE
jgi:serine protease Do